MARMANIRTEIVFFNVLSSQKYDLINSGLMQRYRAKISLSHYNHLLFVSSWIFSHLSPTHLQW